MYPKMNLKSKYIPKSILRVEWIGICRKDNASQFDKHFSKRSIYIHLLFNSFPFPEELNFNNYKLVSRKKSL